MFNRSISLHLSFAAALTISSAAVVLAADANLSPLAAPLQALSADDESARRHALTQLRAALLSQDIDATADTAHAAAITQFNARLDSWLLEMSLLSPAQRAQQIKLLQRDELAPFFAQLFSDDPATRISGLHNLAGRSDLSTGPLLFFFTRDQSTSVSLAAYDALWDLPPTNELADALWSVAIGSELNALFNPTTPTDAPTPIIFRSESLSDSSNPAVLAVRPLSKILFYSANSDAARLVLTHFKSPRVEQLLQQAIDRITPQFASFTNAWRAPVLINALTGMAQQSRSPAVLASLVKLATVPFPGVDAAHAKAPFFRSQRIMAILAVVRMTGQDPVAYGIDLKTPQNMPNYASRADEDQAVQKLQAWWDTTGQHLTTLPPIPATNTVTAAVTEAAPSVAASTKTAEAADPTCIALLHRGAELLSIDDVDAIGNIASLVQFDQRLTLWLQQLNALPSADRLAQIELLRRPTLLPIFAEYFSDAPDMRISSLKRFAAVKEAALTPLLLQIATKDEEASVSVAALETLWDRPMEPYITRTLWALGVDGYLHNAFAGLNSRRTAGPTHLTLRGHPLTDQYYSVLSFLNASSDARGQAARMLLLHAKPPESIALLRESLTQAAQDMAEMKTANTHHVMEVMRPLSTLTSMAVSFHEPSTLPALYALLTAPDTFTPLNAGNLYISARTSAISAFISVSGQKHEDYHLNQRGGTEWTFASKADEDDAVEKLKAWWKTHEAQFATTMPTTTP